MCLQDTFTMAQLAECRHWYIIYTRFWCRERSRRLIIMRKLDVYKTVAEQNLKVYSHQLTFKVSSHTHKNTRHTLPLCVYAIVSCLPLMMVYTVSKNWWPTILRGCSHHEQTLRERRSRDHQTTNCAFAMYRTPVETQRHTITYYNNMMKNKTLSNR